MGERPWLTIIGLGEDGPEGLGPASLNALEAAEIVMAPSRHLSLLPDLEAETVEWPVPFSDGIERLLDLRGRKVVVLASGDPFWFGAGSVLSRHLSKDEWTAQPGLSCFSLAANRLGWALERTICLGLHAAAFARLRPHLSVGQRLIVTVRDGEAVAQLATYLVKEGFGESVLYVLQALGGPREALATEKASDLTTSSGFSHPLCVAIKVQGQGRCLPRASGIDDDWFDHDGQITKRPIRALTLSALTPRPGEHLWDIGGGSGSIAIEWLLSDPSLRATCVEIDVSRANRIQQNAARLGQDRLNVVTGRAPDALQALDAPDVVFVGGGLSDPLIERLSDIASGARVVANAVTLEAEALLSALHSKHGGTLMRIEIANAAPLGKKRGWRASFPIVQWSGTL